MISAHIVAHRHEQICHRRELLQERQDVAFWLGQAEGAHQGVASGRGYLVAALPAGGVLRVPGPVLRVQCQRLEQIDLDQQPKTPIPPRASLHLRQQGQRPVVLTEGHLALRHQHPHDVEHQLRGPRGRTGCRILQQPAPGLQQAPELSTIAQRPGYQDTSCRQQRIVAAAEGSF